ncbi:MAG: flavin reductase family protein [Candidatus Heimdallarchaeota archaeon]
MPKKIMVTPFPAVVPSPAVMVSCKGKEKDSKPNIITLAWVGIVCSDPPTIGISIRPGRYSYSLIKESGEFVVNIPTEALLNEVDFCGMVSGKLVDKFRKTKLTPVPSEKVAAPLIKECPVNMECKLTQIIAVGAHDLFLGEIVTVHIDEAIMRNKGMDITKMTPIAYCSGSSDYWGLKGPLGRYGFTKSAFD